MIHSETPWTAASWGACPEGEKNVIKKLLLTAAAIVGCGFFVLTGQTVAPARGAMPVAQQNLLVEKYCAVCHTEAQTSGGLSLEHFDAAHLDPSLAAMLASKLKDGAMGASGIPRPDRATQDALLAALSAEAAGANEWSVSRTQDAATQAAILTASVLEELPSSRPGNPDLYRLKLTCRADTHDGEIQLAWAPGVPARGQVISAAADGNPPLPYKIAAASDPGDLVLYATEDPASPKFLAPLPAQTLTIRNVFPDETVVFPFDALTPAARQALSACFGGSSASH